MIIQPIMPLLSLAGSIDVNKPVQEGGVQKAGSDFAKFLNDALKEVDLLQKTADTASLGIATGQIQDVHTAIIAMEKASLSLSLTVEVRNKILEAYQEINRMQV